MGLPLMRRAWLMLGVSVAIYLLARRLGWSLPAWQGDGGWFFNPLGWQVLFFVGCALGYRPPGGTPIAIPYRRWVAVLCGVQLLIGLVLVLLTHALWEFAQQWLPGGVLVFLAGIDKTALHPLRLVSMLSLTYLVAHFVRREAGWLHARWAGPFVLMGQQALPVFCSGIALSFFGRVALEWNDRWPMQIAINLLGAGLLVAIAALTAWYAAEKRTPRAPAISALPAAAPADRG